MRCTRSKICARGCSCRSITARSRCRTSGSTSRRAGSASWPNARGVRDQVLVMAAGPDRAFRRNVLLSPRVPDVSIVIPVYNEEGILREAVTELLAGSTASARPCDDDVRDHARGERLARPHRRARRAPRERAPRACARSRSASRTTARRCARGILEARGTWVICEEIDLCDSRLPPARARAPAPQRRRHGRRQQGDEGRERPPAAVPPRRDARHQRHAAGRARLPRHRHARPQGVPAREAARRSSKHASSIATCSRARS